MDGKMPLSAAKKKTWDRDAVPLVCKWALLNAGAIAFGGAVGYMNDHYYHISCSQSSFILPCIELTDAEAAMESALWIGMTWCAAAQAAAAALALLLPCRHRWARRALAYIAFAATVLVHCIHVGAVWIFLVTKPGYIFGMIYFTATGCLFLVCDLFSFMALLLGGDGLGGANAKQKCRTYPTCDHVHGGSPHDE